MNQFNQVGIQTLAKLDVRCAHLAFEEMHCDGFFDSIKIFFLSLTMTEKDPKSDDFQWKTVSTNLLKERLVAKQNHLINQLNEIEDECYRHDDSIRKLREDIYVQKPIKQEENEVLCF